ncbi:MAG: DUF4381 domain-containing protein [Woeseiaceae bacterium]|nr:DUF4381 domain-containing protein [Woeseiaceae bacterium]
MDRYEGKNLPQLLDLLHDIVVPEPVAMTPQTIGWVVVAAWIAAALIIVAVHAALRWRRNRYRRDALRALDSIRGGNAAAEIAVIVKRTALTAFPRSEVANLYGQEWADFLRRTAPKDSRVRRHADELAMAAYRPGLDGEALIDPARRWVRNHRA